MTTSVINPALQSISVIGITGLLGGAQGSGIVLPDAPQAIAAIGAAVDEFFGSVTKHPLAELQAVIRGVPATGDVSRQLKDNQATVDHVLRMTARFDAGSNLIAGAKTVVALQAPFDLGREWRWIPLGKHVGFYMLGHPVTNAEFKTFIKATGRKIKLYLEEKSRFQSLPIDDQPVVYINLEEATAYSQWIGEEMSRRMGVSIIGRLPTDEEWVLAAKGPSKREFINAATDEQAHTNSDATRAVNHPGAYANGYGLKDVIGNVWELTSSQWKDDLRKRVSRGASWGRVFPASVSLYTWRWVATGCAHDGFRPVLVPQKTKA